MKNLDFKKLEEKWNPILEAEDVTPIPKEDKRLRQITALMLENEEKYLNETTFTGDIAQFPKIAIPMVRRTYPALLANQVVGVQPMTGPTGYAFALRYEAGRTYGGYNEGDELGYNKVAPGYTGDASTGEGLVTSAGERMGTPTYTREFSTVNLKIKRAQVEAKTRKILSQWSIEEAQDLKNVHGLDMDAEMLDILSYEIIAEIDRELVHDLSTLAAAGGTTSWECSASDGRWEMERYITLFNHTIRQSNQIAVSTRRGPGNFIIASPTVCSMFEALNNFVYNPDMTQVSPLSSVPFVGTIDRRIKLFCDTFATTDYVIIGYKGASAWDTGLIYLPYINMLVKRVDQDSSFQPRLMVMSRYAKHNNLLGAENYYRLVSVNPNC